METTETENSLLERDDATSETDTEDALRILNIETIQTDHLVTQILQTIVFLQARCFILKAPQI